MGGGEDRQEDVDKEVEGAVGSARSGARGDGVNREEGVDKKEVEVGLSGGGEGDGRTGRGGGIGGVGVCGGVGDRLGDAEGGGQERKAGGGK